MKIENKILEILKKSKENGKGKTEIQNIDIRLLMNGENEYLGSKLRGKLNELIDNSLITKTNSFYSITPKGLEYLEQHSEE